MVVEKAQYSKKSAGKELQWKHDKARDSYVPNNFVLTIPTHEEACKHVVKVDPIMIDFKLARDLDDEKPDFAIQGAQVECSNLCITVAESHADSFRKWFDDFVINGNNGDDQEKNGTLELLTQDRKRKLITVNLGHMGIFRMAPVKPEPGMEEATRRVKIEMYVQAIAVKFAEMAT
jgi:hypothetical protein